MATCLCLIQAGQISAARQAALQREIGGMTQAKLGFTPSFRWTEIAAGSGYTAGVPSTSALVTLTADAPVEQDTREAVLHELCELWTRGAGVTINEIMAVVADPAPR